QQRSQCQDYIKSGQRKDEFSETHKPSVFPTPSQAGGSADCNTQNGIQAYPQKHYDKRRAGSCDGSRGNVTTQLVRSKQVQGSASAPDQVPRSRDEAEQFVTPTIGEELQ